MCSATIIAVKKRNSSGEKGVLFAYWNCVKGREMLSFLQMTGQGDAMFSGFYKGKRVLVTGATGFKGSWLCLWLKKIGADVRGYALPPDTTPALFNVLGLAADVPTDFANILDRDALQRAFDAFKPEIVFHLAAQPLVRLSYAAPVQTYETNVIGTLNVLEAARKCGCVKAFVNVTTDKCYENVETAAGYDETCALGGFDPYASSKACVEIMSASYRRSFLQNGYYMATARAGNVVGGGDRAADRLIPDCVRAIEKGEKIRVRSPESVRPFQYVLEALSGYMILAQKLYESGEKYARAYNFGPDENGVLSVEAVVKTVIAAYGKGAFEIARDESLHEAKLLLLNADRARKELDWRPVMTARRAVELAVEWYRRFEEKKDMRAFSLRQIDAFERQEK